MTTVPQRAEIDAPQMKTVKAEGQWKGQFRTDLDVRDFHFVTAEPEKIGGNNEGPTPMEYVLGALNGCLGVVVELVAKEQGIPLADLKVSSSGLVDQRGLFGTADVSPQFQSVDVVVTLATSAPSAKLATLQQQVLKRCPVYDLIRDSKARIGITWAIESEASR
ncbi:MAG: OsmC family protein [Xanthobacteraceae bacterium]